MNLANRIQAKTDNGDTVIDFLVEVMQGERAGFKICHRLDSARLLTKYGCSCKSAVAGKSAATAPDAAIDFILDNPPEPSRRRSNSGSSRETKFDKALAKAIRESTDDGDSVCRFLINVMEGDLKAFGPQHSMAAARELLSRGFGKDAYTEEVGGSHSSLLSTHSSEQATAAVAIADPGARASRPQKALIAPNSSEETKAAVATVEAEQDGQDWTAFWDELEQVYENERLALLEKDPDNPPYVSDLSAYRKAFENSLKWYEEWKNSFSDPSELEAILAKEAAKFDAIADRKIERRKQIAEDRERRAKEEAEHEAQQAKARAEAQAKAESEPEKPPDPGPPPTRNEHKTWSPTPSIPTSFRLVKCGHPRCKLHDGPIYYPEDDRNSQYYFNGRAPPTFGSYPI